MYNESFSILKNENRLTKSRYGDTGRATVLVVEFLGAQKIVDKFINRKKGAATYLADIRKGEREETDVAKGIVKWLVEVTDETGELVALATILTMVKKLAQ